MNRRPLISVLMAAYNAEKYVALAIKSILNQDFHDWELIIVNDGSLDKTKKIILSFADPRIKYFENPVNKGLVYTRNRLIELSNGEFLAVLDSDDIAYPNRLRVQAAFLSRRRDINVLGGPVDLIDANGIPVGVTWRYPTGPAQVAATLFFRNTFAHSSIMLRSETLRGHKYRHKYPPAEDFALWSELSSSNKMANLRVPLCAYRLHSTSISQQQYARAVAAESKILITHLRQMNITGMLRQNASLASALFHGHLTKYDISNNSTSLLNILCELWTHRYAFPENVNYSSLAILLLHYQLIVLRRASPNFVHLLLTYFTSPIGNIPYKFAALIQLITKKLRFFLDTQRIGTVRDHLKTIEAFPAQEASENA